MTATLATLGVGGAGAPAVLLQDTFTDANGIALTAHTMDVGGGWTLQGANGLNVANNAAVASQASTACEDTADAGQADTTSQVDVTLAGTGNFAGLVFRFTDTSNYWLLYYDQAAAQLNLRETLAGTNTNRGQTSLTLNTGTTYTFKVVCSGSSITCSVAGTQYFSITNTDLQTATKYGLRQTGTTTTTYDNLKVTKP